MSFISRSVLVLAYLIVVLMPLGGAVDVGCVESRDGDALVVIPPQGQATNFTPSCVILANGETITWQNFDSQVHDPTLWGCFDPGLFSPLQRATVALEWDAQTETLWATPAGGEPAACSGFGPEGEPLVQPGEAAVEIRYFCQVHPLAMIGKVVLGA